MRILFITSSRIGDAVISSGVLEHVRLAHPEARITVACGAAAAGVFRRLPGLERLIVFEKLRYDLHWLKLWTRLVGRFWDIVIDVRGSAIALFLAAQQRFMLRAAGGGGPRYAAFGASMGLTPPPLPVVWTAPADEARAAAVLGDGPLIGFGPTANWDGKIWPAERFVALFHALAPRWPGLRPVIFAGPGAAERRAAAPVLEALPNAVDAVGQLSLTEVAAGMKRLVLFVGNDSGLMHIAAAAGAPTLGLFGPSPAATYAPAGRRTAVAVAPGPPGAAPITGLTVASALAAAQTLL
jgi:ADP-heptose:LPS heptosyltransferase